VEQRALAQFPVRCTLFDAVERGTDEMFAMQQNMLDDPMSAYAECPEHLERLANRACSQYTLLVFLEADPAVLAAGRASPTPTSRWLLKCARRTWRWRGRSLNIFP